MTLKPETRSRESIRSFVVRAGRMTTGQQRAIDSLWPRVGCRVADGQYHPADANKPLILDIGFGMGHALASCALENPGNEYVGVEVYPPGVGSLLAELQKLQLNNCRVYCADVMLVLEHCLAEASLAGVQIFFPDPWHKKRHHKRRLIQSAFLQLLATKLKPGGFLHVATDWQPYAEVVEAVIVDSECFVLQTACANPRATTKFERRGQRLGHEVSDIFALKV